MKSLTQKVLSLTVIALMMLNVNIATSQVAIPWGKEKVNSSGHHEKDSLFLMESILGTTAINAQKGLNYTLSSRLAYKTGKTFGKDKVFGLHSFGYIQPYVQKVDGEEIMDFDYLLIGYLQAGQQSDDQDGMRAKLGYTPSAMTMERPHPVTDGGHFENPGTAIIPGAGWGISVENRWDQKHFIRGGLWQRGEQTELQAVFGTEFQRKNSVAIGAMIATNRSYSFLLHLKAGAVEQHLYYQDDQNSFVQKLPVDAAGPTEMQNNIFGMVTSITFLEDFVAYNSTVNQNKQLFGEIGIVWLTGKETSPVRYLVGPMVGYRTEGAGIFSYAGLTLQISNKECKKSK